MYIGLENFMIINSGPSLNWSKRRRKKKIRHTKNLTLFISNLPHKIEHSYAVWW